MRLRTLSIAPIAIISMLAASTPAVAVISEGPAIAAVYAAQAPVDLGTASTFAILSKTGVTDVVPSVIRGNVGASPITGAATLLTCSAVTGHIFTVDAAGPLPCRLTDPVRLTTAVANMEAAYTDAAGRATPDVVDLGAGVIGGQTLVPGLYKWNSTLTISDNITLEGGPEDVWIFQVAGTLTEASAKKIILKGGAMAKNVVWQVAGAVTIGTTARFEGTILAKTMIAMNTGAVIRGRLLAQTAVTLQMNTVQRSGL